MATSPAILALRIKHSVKLPTTIGPDENLVEQNLERSADYAHAYKNRTLTNGRGFNPLMIDTADMFAAVPNAIREAANRARSYFSYMRNPSGDSALNNVPVNFTGVLSHPEMFIGDIAPHKGLDTSPLRTARSPIIPDVGFWNSRRSLNTPKFLS